MKLTAHVIEAKPSPGDPLAQRGFVALIWEGDKELVEFEGGLAPDDIAAHVALVTACRVGLTIHPGTPPLSNGAILRNIARYAQKLVDQADLAADASPPGGSRD